MFACNVNNQGLLKNYELSICVRITHHILYERVSYLFCYDKNLCTIIPKGLNVNNLRSNRGFTKNTNSNPEWVELMIFNTYGVV